MKVLYQADNGIVFDNKECCERYERETKLEDLIQRHLGPTVQLTAAATEAFMRFIETNIDQINAIVGFKRADGWVDNIDHPHPCHPDSLPDDQEVEVRFRNSDLSRGEASRWGASWRSTDNDPFDIVAYRVLG